MEDGRAYDSYNNLFIATLSGGQRRRITFLPGRDAQQGVFDFDVSRDGRRVAFNGVTEAGKGLYVMRIDGGGRRKLVERDSRWPVAPEVAWSPDGQRIAFFEFRDNGAYPPVYGRVPTIPHVINADGSGLKAVGPPINGGGLLWAPDGKHLAYLSGSPLPKTFIASLAGGEPRLLHSEFLLLAWSPDGRKMLWHDRRQLSKSLPGPAGAFNRSMLWVSGPESADLQPLTAEDAWVRIAAWSPDSRFVAYTVPVPPSGMTPVPSSGMTPAPATTLGRLSRQLWTVNVETDERRLVATFPGRDSGKLEWTRDGKAIYVLTGREFGIVYDLWAVPSPRGEPMKIIDGVYDFRLISGSLF